MARVQHRRAHPAHGEQDGREHHQPREIDGQIAQLVLAAGALAQAGRDELHEHGREQEADDSEDQRGEGHQMQYGAGEPPGRRFALFGEQPSEGGDEGGAQRRARQHLEDQVRQPEGHPVGV